MRKHSLIFLLLFAFVFMMADAPLALFSGRESGYGVSQSDSVRDSSDLRGKENNRKKKSRDKDDAKMLAKGLTENSDSLASWTSTPGVLSAWMSNVSESGTITI